MVHQNVVCSDKFGSAAGNGWMIGFIVVFVLAFAATSFSQTKPERQSKAVKPTQAAPTSSAPTAEANAPSDSESNKPEDRPFKGMKYRLVGPFRGGRSLA